MKSVLLPLLVVLGYNVAKAQDPPKVPIPIDSTTGQIQFREVIQLEGSMTMPAIIQAARKWVATTYQDANKVIQQYDPEGGILIAKGIMPVHSNVLVRPGSDKLTPANYLVQHILTVEAKPGRCRVTMDGYQIRVDAPPSPYMPRTLMEYQPYTAVGCITDAERYRVHARKEWERLGVGGKLYNNSMEKNLPNSLINARVLCDAVKQTSEKTINSLRDSMVKTAKEAGW